jgi:hypothetical protein
MRGKPRRSQSSQGRGGAPGALDEVGRVAATARGAAGNAAGAAGRRWSGHPRARGKKRQRYICRLIRTCLVERQPRQIAGAAAGVAASRQVERVGELPFLRLVAPLDGRRTGDVVGLTVGANRRGSRGPVFLMSRGWGRLRRLLEWIAQQSKSQDAPPIIPVSTAQHNFGRFGCLHARRNCLCIPPVLLIRKTARV